ncbi:hypothetical protein SERLA73DRAFT_171234 [Serpula lacrymans var. lacrymans S7.3]|uniref:LAA1-like C-terminal TPR repeats domain-containing protein n=2 Tax=Serpula lacrymans var. lacrymans TaxID=341189 RepID=F8Q9U5_SERL3|nr:uncharacterized protein SERLADRAFT_453023 [Serpula lacrymans var. lacrymans S7.9]EGN94850.1 hypothetical protein SERLA73DRAFT_171234 [Serpula lacrymans var. lacrymans S7.3]EGO20347.1 hypothetical protein SERLADRAFT_453023 [Serpula lacrymans var. lacrymans S7.9]
MAAEVTIDEIDESQLSGENGELYLFQWLCSLEEKLKDAPHDQIKASQPHVESTLVKAITRADQYPIPGRILRNPVARCLISLYTRGESKTLFDTLQTFVKVAGDFKSSDKETVRTAALYCIGELMAVFGSQFMSFMVEIATISLKTYKSSGSPLIRHHALSALRKALTTARKAVTDAISKDIIKQMKYGLSDKALAVQRAAAGIITVGEVESIVILSTKNLDNADHVTRQSLAQLVGHVLSLTQIERVIPAPESTQKGKKENEEDQESAPSHMTSEQTKALLSPQEMFSQLSSLFNKPQTSRKARAGIFDFYIALLNKLGSSFAESNYALIVSHLMTEIVSNPKNSATRYDKLFLRKLIGLLLRDLIAVRMLTEQGQIGAIRELSSSYLKRWPALMPGHLSPNSLVLTIVLRELAGLLQQLGNAPPPVQEAVSEPLVTLLSHSSHTVRVNAAWALRCFCYSTPLRLPKVILVIIEFLQRDIDSLQSPAAPSDVDLRALGHAYGLAALVAIIPRRPLYVSYDITAKVLDIATQLLKRASDHDVKIAGVEVEVAWTCIASLMLLGPNFVRPHLPQLLVLWRNALPKPTSKDNPTGRTVAEWEFLLHVRESALGAILCFLRHNTPLLTLDVARRVSTLLGNALSFLNTINSQSFEDSSTSMQTDQKGLSLRSREALLRRRVYQAFTALGTASLTESVQTTLLQSAIALFASPDGFAGSSMQAAIASSSGALTSIWQCADGYAYGVTSIDIAEGGAEGDDNSPEDEFRLVEAPSPITAVVDSAIELFAQLLPVQDLASTTRTVSQLVETVRSSKLEKNAGRRTAMFVNSVIAIVQSLRHAMTSHYRQARETFGSSQITSVIAPFMKDALVDGDSVLRSASSEAIGRMANIAGTTFLTSQIKVLVDHVVNNRDPQGRAGCALAFGAIYSHVGGLAAGPLLKTTVNILMSLSNDPHPLVHFWSLNALARVINAANLAYSSFVPGTLGMLLKIYNLDSHEIEGGTLNNSNSSGDLAAYPVVCQIIDAIITVLGPDIQDSVRTRTLVLNMVHEFSLEDDDDICVEAIKCMQHFLMFAPEHVHIPEMVDRFRYHLASSRRKLKLASIDALYQLVQRDALAMSRLGGDRLVEHLFGMLDDDSSVEGVKNVISSWLQQTAVHNPSAWIDLCQRIMLRTTASQQVATITSNTNDDEGESLSGTMASEANNQHQSTAFPISRWRTQLFALHCLHDICTILTRSGRREHFDIPFARSHGLASTGLLVSRVPDLIKMAFTASAAYVTEIRLEGLVVLQDVIKIFAKSPDPDYSDALLLEQHQAPITAALTPAFSADSTPEILASAIRACAVFVGCGIIKEVNRMGRVLKMLTLALEQLNDTGNLSLGDSVDLSPNASGMLRISVLSAWAQLESASAEQTYLLDILKPHRRTLATLWIASLRDYAVIRADSEFIQDASSALDPSFSSLGKVVLLPYYIEYWPIILQAVASAMEHSDPHIKSAILGQIVPPNAPAPNSTPRTEPADFFFIIFGQVYEALTTASPGPTEARTTVMIAALRALKCIVSPQYSGKALLDPIILREFTSLCYRLAMVESANILVHLLDVLVAFQSGFEDLEKSEVFSAAPSSVRGHCLKIAAYVLRHSHPTSAAPAIQGGLAAKTKMVRTALLVFQVAASAAEPSTKEDIRSVACMLYGELLKDESSEDDLVEPTLPALKSLLSVPIHDSTGARTRFEESVHGFLSSCLLNVDEMRGRQGVISSRKVKNNLLAAVLILTTMPPQIKIARGVIEHCSFLISQKLLEATEMALVAAHCSKTVTIAASANIPLRFCIKLLLPSLVEYIAKVSPRLDDGSMSEQDITAIDEVLKTFAALVTMTTNEQRDRVLSIILPTITLLLRPAQATLPTVHAHSVAQLLTFATSSPTSFKEVTARLEAPVREVLEQSVRRAVAGATAAEPHKLKPQISLRSF